MTAATATTSTWPGTTRASSSPLEVERFAHASGIAGLRVERRLRVPARLEADRETRSRERAELRLRTELRVAPGVPRVDAHVQLWNAARDHRLRLLFPVGAGVSRCDAATTFDVVPRGMQKPDDAGWVQRAVGSFACQGFVHAGGLSVVAPGLTEAELVATPAGAALAFTLLRAVGNLSRHDLRSRPGPAGPGTDTPGAQCPGLVEARLALFAGLDPAAARDAELGLRAVPCGADAARARGARSRRARSARARALGAEACRGRRGPRRARAESDWRNARSQPASRLSLRARGRRAPRRDAERRAGDTGR